MVAPLSADTQSNCPLDDMEPIYKYYIHHGVSIYLVAESDPSTDRDTWIVRLQNVYTPGHTRQSQPSMGVGSDTQCIWACTSGIHTCTPNGSDYPNNRYETNMGIRMTSCELKHLMTQLETKRIFTGPIILE